MNIFVSGSIARDLIMDFPGRFADYIDPQKIHVLNLSFAVNNLQQNIGGTAANISYNLALLGERPEILGSVGQDQKNLVDYFHQLGIGTACLRISKRWSTAAAYIITDKNDNQLAGFYAGAMNEQIKLPKGRTGDWAIVAAENPKNMEKLIKFYFRKKINYIFDPGQQITSLSTKALQAGARGAKVLIGNDYEIGLISKRIHIKVPIIVKTLGPKGSEILMSGKKIRIGIAKPKKVIDPTGAGDAYRAGLVKGIIMGLDWKLAGQLGATVAVFAIEEYGTQNHRFNYDMLVKRHNKNFSDTI